MFSKYLRGALEGGCRLEKFCSKGGRALEKGALGKNAQLNIATENGRGQFVGCGPLK